MRSGSRILRIRIDGIVGLLKKNIIGALYSKIFMFFIELGIGIATTCVRYGGVK